MTETKHIPAMSPHVLHDYLRELGKRWVGKGVAVELGSWLGATAVPLLEGLNEAKYNLPFYCFDRWKANGEQVIKAKEQGLLLEIGQNLLPIFSENVLSVYSNVIAQQGNLPTSLKAYHRSSIEICLFDAPKSEPVFSECIRILSPYWIEGVTILGLLDYNFYRSKTDTMSRNKYLAPVRFMDNHKENFEVLMKWSGSSEVFFKYVKKLGRV